MQTEGLTEVGNPSSLFLTNREDGITGATVFPALEGRGRCWSKSRR